jgi:DNA-binding response OmpR family regulator
MPAKILLVDDANTVLMMERMMLKEAGYDVITARDGEEGVAAALAQRPDLILLDVCMPKMDGFEACRRLRANEATKKIPIIMVTTRSESQNLRAGYEAGCNEYLTKPFNGVELVQKLDKYLKPGSK